MILPPPPILTERHALFLDFDGTLASLQDDADTVRLTDAQENRLVVLAARRDGALALVSGRDVRDLSQRTPTVLMRVGNHGLYQLAPGETEVTNLEPIPERLENLLSEIAQARDGVHLEVKGPVGTLHFRANPAMGPQLTDAVQSAVATRPDYRCKIGNHVVEAIPAGANKGMAVERLMRAAPFQGRIPVMVGDDTTDEDGFLAAQRLGGFGVKVGLGDTVARKGLPDVQAVWTWLEGIE